MFPLSDIISSLCIRCVVGLHLRPTSLKTFIDKTSHTDSLLAFVITSLSYLRYSEICPFKNNIYMAATDWIQLGLAPNVTHPKHALSALTSLGGIGIAKQANPGPALQQLSTRNGITVSALKVTGLFYDIRPQAAGQPSSHQHVQGKIYSNVQS